MWGMHAMQRMFFILYYSYNILKENTSGILLCV